MYYPGSPDPKKPLHEEMTLTDAGLQAQVGLPIIYLIAPKITFISEQEALAPLASDAVLAPPGAYKKPSDLSARTGTLMLVEYTEARPPLIAKPGMGAKKVVYYRRKTLGDQGARPYAQHDHHSDRSQAERTVAVPRRTSARTRRHGIRDVHVQSAVVPTTEIGQLRRLLTDSSAERTDDAARRRRFTSPDSKSHTSRFPVREATC